MEQKCLHANITGRLDLSSSVYSPSFSKQHVSDMAVMGSESLDAVWCSLQDLDHALAGEYGGVHTLDLSYSWLIAEDIPLLCAVLKRLPSVATLCLGQSPLLDDIDVPALCAAAPRLGTNQCHRWHAHGELRGATCVFTAVRHRPGTHRISGDRSRVAPARHVALSVC
jgi:hypothetical protein